MRTRRQRPKWRDAAAACALGACLAGAELAEAAPGRALGCTAVLRAAAAAAQPAKFALSMQECTDPAQADPTGPAPAVANDDAAVEPRTADAPPVALAVFERAPATIRFGFARPRPIFAGAAPPRFDAQPGLRAPAGPPWRLASEIGSAALRFDIDPLLLHAIAHVESRHNPAAVSSAGARGLMQVMPATARRFGVTEPLRALHDPTTNLEVAAAYLKELQARFGNDLTLVLAAYNAGEGAVERYGRRIPPFPETRQYVGAVLSNYLGLRAQRAQARPIDRSTPR